MTKPQVWPKVDPGSLRHQITIRTRGSIPDSSGRPQPWQTVWSGYASIVGLTERELFQANQITSQFTHRVSFPWPGSGIIIQPAMEVVFGSKVFKIQVVDNVNEMNIVVQLLCLALNEPA